MLIILSVRSVAQRFIAYSYWHISIPVHINISATISITYHLKNLILLCGVVAFSSGCCSDISGPFRYFRYFKLKLVSAVDVQSFFFFFNPCSEWAIQSGKHSDSTNMRFKRCLSTYLFRRLYKSQRPFCLKLFIRYILILYKRISLQETLEYC